MGIMATSRLGDIDIDHKLVEDIYDLRRVGITYDLLMLALIIYE